MKNVVVKFKAGRVAFGHNFAGEVVCHKFEEETPFGFEKVNNMDPGIDNVFWHMDTVLQQVSEFVKANPQERVQVAVPGTVYALASNLEMLTKLMWTKRKLYSTVTDQKSHRTILLHKKSNETYPLIQAEEVMYRKLFMHIRSLMGYVLFVDSQFICKPENAKTADQIAFTQLNEKVNAELGIGMNTARNPYENRANSTDASVSYSIPPMGDDSDDLPF